MLVHLVTIERLRQAGYDPEADRLEEAVRRHKLWRPATDARSPAPSESAIALSVFGNVRYDELARALEAAV